MVFNLESLKLQSPLGKIPMGGGGEMVKLSTYVRTRPCGWKNRKVPLVAAEKPSLSALSWNTPYVILRGSSCLNHHPAEESSQSRMLAASCNNHLEGWPRQVIVFGRLETMVRAICHLTIQLPGHYQSCGLI